MIKTITTACKGAASIPIDKLINFQGGLKILQKPAFEKFKRQIIDLGFSEPVSVWLDGGK